MIEVSESPTEILQRHKRFFDNRPLMRCLDGDTGAEAREKAAYGGASRETRHFKDSQPRAGPSKHAFWENIRMGLNVDDEGSIEEDEENGDGIWARMPQSAVISVRRKMSNQRTSR